MMTCEPTSNMSGWRMCHILSSWWINGLISTSFHCLRTTHSLEIPKQYITMIQLSQFFKMRCILCRLSNQHRNKNLVSTHSTPHNRNRRTNFCSSALLLFPITFCYDYSLPGYVSPWKNFNWTGLSSFLIHKDPKRFCNES